ncbi:hypothetical protein ACLQ2Y_26010 [Micromonospora echinospora]
MTYRVTRSGSSATGTTG